MHLFCHLIILFFSCLKGKFTNYTIEHNLSGPKLVVVMTNPSHSRVWSTAQTDVGNS